MRSSSTSAEWPPLPFDEWENTCDTVHMWTQIVGKTCVALSTPVNHWWHIALQVTPRGLRTAPIPYRGLSFDVEFDFVAHRVVLRSSDGREGAIRMYARSVADFYTEYMSSLRSLGIEVRIARTPVEFDDMTPFDEDQHHASYDVDYVDRFRRILIRTDARLREHRSPFLGKCSPVHFFWGSFDLAVTRFSGRRAPARSDGDSMMGEAYSHEVISCGFWPGDRRFRHPAFYAYAAPVPDGLSKETVRPGAAYWDTNLGGEFILKYDDMRNLASPDEALLDFCQSTYEAGAKLAGWDREQLERQAT